MLSPAASLLRRQALPVQQQARAMGGGPSAPRGYGKGPYRGFEMPAVDAWKRDIATAFGCMATLWFLYRCKQDGKAFLVRAGSRPSPRSHAHRPRTPLSTCMLSSVATRLHGCARPRHAHTGTVSS
jgi:hypothetical protein